MIYDLCKAGAMNLRVPGRSLYEAECPAIILMIQRVLLFALPGFRISRAEREDQAGIPPRPLPWSRVTRNGRGILPAGAGTAEGRFRPLPD